MNKRPAWKLLASDGCRQFSMDSKNLKNIFCCLAFSRRGGSGAWGEAPAKMSDRMSDIQLCVTFCPTQLLLA